MVCTARKGEKSRPRGVPPLGYLPPGERLLEWGEMAGVHRWDFTYYIGKKSGDVQVRLVVGIYKRKGESSAVLSLYAGCENE